MSASTFPYLSLGILAMLVGGIAFSVTRIRRTQAMGIVLTTTLLVGLGIWSAIDAGAAWQRDGLCSRLGIDSGTGWTMWVLCLMDLLIVLVAPEQDLRRGIVGGALILSAGNLIAYGAHDLMSMWAGWIVGSIPFVVGDLRRDVAARSVLMPAVGSVIVFGLALMAQAMVARPLTVSTLILVAVALRKGILPFHGWVVRAFAESPLVWIMLLFNGHLGGLLLLRHAIARHGLESGLVEIATGIVILSSIVCSLRGLVEPNPVGCWATCSLDSPDSWWAAGSSRTPRGSPERLSTGWSWSSPRQASSCSFGSSRAGSPVLTGGVNLRVSASRHLGWPLSFCSLP